MFLGSKGHGRSTLLEFLSNPIPSGSSSLIMRSFFKLDLGDKQHPAGIIYVIDVLTCICIDSVESSIASHKESLDIGTWNCDYLNSHKLHKKTSTSSLSIEKSISFRTWDFSGDVSTCINFTL